MIPAGVWGPHTPESCLHLLRAWPTAGWRLNKGAKRLADGGAGRSCNAAVPLLLSTLPPDHTLPFSSREDSCGMLIAPLGSVFGLPGETLIKLVQLSREVIQWEVFNAECLWQYST